MDLNRNSPPFFVLQCSECIMASTVKLGFPVLTNEEAVANCKSMFGVSLTVDDLLKPQVKSYS